MFETTKIVLLNNSRDLFSKMKDSPGLYIFFGIIMFFSILLFAFLGYYIQIIDTGLDITIEEMFFMVFFIFMTKSGYDFFNNYVKSEHVIYALSTPIEQKKTITEIYYAILLTNLFIWFVLSFLFLFFLYLLTFDIFYPFEYFYFTIGILTAMIIAPTIIINFFSNQRLRLIPTIILLAFIFYIQSPLYIIFIFPLTLFHLTWSLKYALSSYQNIRRKPRINERSQVKIRKPLNALFHKETTLFWRDKLFFSFIFSSSATGIGTGYLYLNGNDLLIPESLQTIYANFLPSLFIFIGVLVVIIYTSVFPSVALFLNEEKTLWIIRHTPIDTKILIWGKATTLFLSFLTSIPFIFFTILFIGLDLIFFMLWLLVFSFIASAVLSIPLGVKYLGKKSDVMLLYSITMILLVILSPIAFIGGILYTSSYWGFFSIASITFAMAIFFLSLKLSEKLFRLTYPITH